MIERHKGRETMNQTVKLILGYICFVVFTCGIMLVGALAEKKIKSEDNRLICRKLTHIVSSLLWIICWYFFGCSLHWVILNGVGALTLGIITFTNKMKTFYGEDAKKSYGIFYFSLSTFVVALVCYLIGPEVYYFTGIAYYCLALGDGFAPITAKLTKKFNPQIMPGKSLLGSLTVFVISFVATLVFSIIFKMQLDLLFIFSVASLTCIMEFYGLKGIDNLLIEFSVFGYLLLYYFGYVSLVLKIVVLTSPVIALIAIGLKSLTVSGGICGMVLFYLIAFFSKGPVPVLSITLLFVVATVIAFITQRILNKRSAKKPEKYARSGRQLMAVGLVAVICLIIDYFTKIQHFYLLYLLALTEQFADSMASDIGRLTRGRNLDIIRFKPVEKGVSGGVSLLGTVCALVASVLLLLVPFLFHTITLWQYLLGAGIAFVGTLLDSVLGSLFQALYRCQVCGAATEMPTHCDSPATRVKGFKWMGNTTVNLMTGVLTCGIGSLLLLV